MSEAAQRRESLYGLEGVHLDAYDAIVQPGRVFGVRIYTLRRWAPILGATGFWLLVALQQLCYRNPKGANWCVASREVLAREAGLGEATVHRYLHEQEQVSHGLCHWVRPPSPGEVRNRRRWSSKAGRMTQAASRYIVVMDAPLAPVDQRGLAQLLQERGAAPGVPQETVEPTLKHLAELTLADLLDLLDGCAARFRPPEGWDEQAFYPTVADVATALGIRIDGGEEGRTRFLELCSRVHQALVGQMHLGTHYFRRQWVSLLGHKLALIVLQLRSRCFWNEEVLRDEVSVGTKDLAATSGCTPGWLRQLFRDPDPLASRFFTVIKRGSGRRPPTLRVTLREPIVPENEDEYQALLNAGTIIPETGQLGLPEPNPGVAEEAIGGTGEHLGDPQAVLVNVSESVGGTGERLGTSQAVLVNVSEPLGGTGERLGSTVDGTGEQHASTIVVSTNALLSLKEQKHAGGAAASAAAALLLEEFGIGPPASSRILSAGTDPDVIRAWMLYALTQPGLQDPRGYVVNRLRAGEVPPGRFHRWAVLTPDEWQALWRAAHYAGPYAEVLSPALDADLDAWRDDFAGVFPKGPFGDGVFDWAALRERVMQKLDMGVDFTFREARDCQVTVVPVAQTEDETCAWMLYDWPEHREEIAAVLREQGVLHHVCIDMSQPDGGVDAFVRYTIWEVALRALRLQMTQATFDAWLRDSKLLSCEDRVYVIGVRSERAKAWLENRLLGVIERTLQRMERSEDVSVRFEVLDGEREEIEERD